MVMLLEKKSSGSAANEKLMEIRDARQVDTSVLESVGIDSLGPDEDGYEVIARPGRLILRLFMENQRNHRRILLPPRLLITGLVVFDKLQTKVLAKSKDLRGRDRGWQKSPATEAGHLILTPPWNAKKSLSSLAVTIRVQRTLDLDSLRTNAAFHVQAHAPIPVYAGAHQVIDLHQ